MRRIMLIVAAAALCRPGFGDAVTLKHALSTENVEGANVLASPSFERVEDGVVTGTTGWEQGYEIDETVARSGERSVRVSSDDAEIEHGVCFQVELAQERPAPVLASGWSRCEDVEGTAGSGYSLWVDIEFTDGSHLWGQNAPFARGSHDWQQRSIPIAASKPIKWIRVYGLFRHTTGTAWFDDFALIPLELEEGARTFNGVPVLAGEATVDAPEAVRVSTGDGLALDIDRNTGAFLGEGGRASGIFLRDAAAGSDFRQPRSAVKSAGRDVELQATDDDLQLELDATVSPRDDHITITGTVSDLTGEDRAISVYVAFPCDARGGTWFDDQHFSREIEEPLTYANLNRSGAGPRGMASPYPLGCVATDDEGLAIGVPMDQPRVMELAYDAGSRELYAAFHLGLSAATRHFPSSANFAVAIYPVDPEWGFRDALRRYYALYPDCFTKRNRREGIWMPFTDVSTVEGWEDFGFAFHEGDNNVAFDDTADIASFVYCEPVAYWMRMKSEEPRTHENIVRLLREAAEVGNALAQAAIDCVVWDPQGTMMLEARDAPWCDGARFFLNPSPNLYADDERQSRGELLSAMAWRAFERNAKISGWRDYEGGFTAAEEAGRESSGAIQVMSDAPGKFGTRQSVAVHQEQARDLVISGWGKCEELSAPEAAEWWLYVDITYSDGDHLWGQKAVFDPTAEGWQQARYTIDSEKPVQSAAVYAMLRGDTTGRVLFDDLFFGEEGGENLLNNPGFESTEAGDLDGIYIDSSEMAATLTNYRREHWPDARTPLTFDRTGRVCQLTIFNTTEFARGLSEPLHERGELLFANSTPNRFPWLAAWLDVMGTETNWSRGEGYTPMSVPELAYRRAICHQRPFLFLQNTVYEDFKPEWVELYFKRSIAWGHFPSFFSHNAADDPYWQRPKLYNRDRPLFQKYIPVCATLSRAGWEPVTHAGTTAEHVYVERFGPAEDGSIYLTVFNDGEEHCDADIEVDPVALPVQNAEEVLPDGPEPIRRAKTGVWTVPLEAQDLAVLKLSERR